MKFCMFSVSLSRTSFYFQSPMFSRQRLDKRFWSFCAEFIFFCLFLIIQNHFYFLDFLCVLNVNNTYVIIELWRQLAWYKLCISLKFEDMLSFILLQQKYQTILISLVVRKSWTWFWFWLFLSYLKNSLQYILNNCLILILKI